MTKADKIVYKIGVAAVFVAALCLGWNSGHFKD